jgi:hypothetical protein
MAGQTIPDMLKIFLPTAGPGETGFLDQKQLLARLPVSRRTLFNLRQSGLPSIPIPGSRKVLFHWDSVRAFLIRQQRGGAIRTSAQNSQSATSNAGLDYGGSIVGKHSRRPRHEAVEQNAQSAPARVATADNFRLLDSIPEGVELKALGSTAESDHEAWRSWAICLLDFFTRFGVVCCRETDEMATHRLLIVAFASGGIFMACQTMTLLRRHTFRKQGNHADEPKCLHRIVDGTRADDNASGEGRDAPKPRPGPEFAP